MNIISGVLFILIACFAAVILKATKPEFSFLLTTAVSLIVVAFIVNAIIPYINKIHSIFQNSSLSSNYFFTVLKAVIICYITKFASDICKDNGQTALSSKAELIGRVSLIILSVPFLKDIMDIALTLIK